MSVPGRRQVFLERNPGVVRAAIVAADGRPWHLFQSAWDGVRAPVQLGALVRVTVRAVSKEGAFVELDGDALWSGGHEQGLIDRRHADGLNEGDRVAARAVSAARRDHLAKLVPFPEGGAEDLDRTPLQAWLTAFGLTDEALVEVPAGRLDAAFEETLLAHVPVPGGGRLHIERTKALTAIDIDAADRPAKGSAGARALSLNVAAVKEAARQICLRGLGGAVVMDCVAPLNKSSSETLKETFQQAWARHSPLEATVLRPSLIGLMQVAVPWTRTPWDEVLATAEQGLLDALRRADRELSASRGGFYTLRLGQAVYEAYLARKPLVDTVVQAGFHGRLKLAKAEGGADGLEAQ